MLVQVMTHLGMQEIPAGNIAKRWTRSRSARDIAPDHLAGYPKDMTPGMQQAYRYSALYAAAMELVDLGASSDDAFAIATAALAQAKQKILEAGKSKDGARSAEQPTHSTASAQGSNAQDMSAVTMDLGSRGREDGDEGSAWAQAQACAAFSSRRSVTTHSRSSHVNHLQPCGCFVICTFAVVMVVI